MIYSVDMYIFKDGAFVTKKNLILCEKLDDAKIAFDSIISKYNFKKYGKIILEDPIIDTAYGIINGYSIDLDISELKLNNYFDIDLVTDNIETIKNMKSCYLISKIICVGEEVSYKTEYFATSLEEILNMMDKLEVDRHLVVATPPINIINRFRTRRENIPNGAIYYIAHRVDHKE